MNKKTLMITTAVTGTLMAAPAAWAQGDLFFPGILSYDMILSPVLLDGELRAVVGGGVTYQSASGYGLRGEIATSLGDDLPLHLGAVAFLRDALIGEIGLYATLLAHSGDTHTEIGIEGEYYHGDTTFDGSIGLASYDNNDSVTVLRAGVAHYIHQNLKVFGRASFADGDFDQLGVGAEYKLASGNIFQQLIPSATSAVVFGKLSYIDNDFGDGDVALRAGVRMLFNAPEGISMQQEDRFIRKSFSASIYNSEFRNNEFQK